MPKFEDDPKVMIDCLAHRCRLSDTACLARYRRALSPPNNFEIQYVGLEKCLECETGKRLADAESKNIVGSDNRPKTGGHAGQPIVGADLCVRPFIRHKLNHPQTKEEKMEPQKICKRCGKGKPISEFGHHHSTKDGLSTLCRDCFSLMTKESAKKRYGIGGAGLKAGIDAVDPPPSRPGHGGLVGSDLCVRAKEDHPPQRLPAKGGKSSAKGGHAGPLLRETEPPTPSLDDDPVAIQLRLAVQATARAYEMAKSSPDLYKYVPRLAVIFSETLLRSLPWIGVSVLGDWVRKDG